MSPMVPAREVQKGSEMLHQKRWITVVDVMPLCDGTVAIYSNRPTYQHVVLKPDHMVEVKA